MEKTWRVEYEKQFTGLAVWIKLLPLRPAVAGFPVAMVDFEVVSIFGWNDDGIPILKNLFQPEESQLFLSGVLKADGCTHLFWGERSDHLCDGLSGLSELFTHLDEKRVEYCVVEG